MADWNRKYHKPTRVSMAAALVILFSLLALPAQAQLERVVADAKGITWPTCAAMMEMGLKRLDGVDKVAISIERQQFVVLYKGNSVFQPDQLRAAVAEAGVGVAKFHVQVRGKVEKQGTGRTLIAGKDKYIITADSKEVPLATELVITGDIANDKQAPYQLKIVDFKPAGAGSAAKPATNQPAPPPAKK